MLITRMRQLLLVRSKISRDRTQTSVSVQLSSGNPEIPVSPVGFPGNKALFPGREGERGDRTCCQILTPGSASILIYAEISS